MKICIITPALPPKLNGIGDYSALLAAELSRSAEVTLLCGSENPDPISGVSVQTPFDALNPASVTGLVEAIGAARPDWVVLQYNPFSYGKWGLNLHLPRAMHEIKRKFVGVRTAIMVHEPFVPIDNYKFAVFTTWQRWQMWQLCRGADRVFFSIQPWADKFKSWFPNKQLTCSVVGSNIPFIPADKGVVRAELGISNDTMVLGCFGSTHPSRLISWVRDAEKAVLSSGLKAMLLYVGPGKAEMEQTLGELPHICTGALSAVDVSRAFAAMDIHLSPFDDGISTRRGSFLAGIQHSLPTVATYGYNTSNVLKQYNKRAYFLADVRTPGEFSTMVCELASNPNLRKSTGAEARLLFDRMFSWETIAEDLSRMLASSEPRQDVLSRSPLNDRHCVQPEQKQNS